MSKSEGKKISIKFTQPIIGDISTNISAFAITGKEYLYTDGPDNNGPLIDKIYTINSIENHSTIENTITLNTNNFNNSIGLITVKYNHLIGTLLGVGGVVDSFEETFNPMELKEQGNPRVREYITANIGGLVDFIPIEKINIYSKEYITANISGSVELIHIDDINP